MKTLTHVTLVLDESGSMAAQRNDTITGLRSYFDDLRHDTTSQYDMTVIKFNTDARVIMERKPISEVFVSTLEYRPQGGTALIDAVGDALARIPAKTNFAANPEPRWVKDSITGEEFFAQPLLTPEKNIFIVLTDGEENMSRRHSLDNVRQIIEAYQSKENWAFLFMGASPELWQGARRLGMYDNQFVSYSGYDPIITWKGISSGTRRYSSGAILAANVASSVTDSMKEEVKWQDA